MLVLLNRIARTCGSSLKLHAFRTRVPCCAGLIADLKIFTDDMEIRVTESNKIEQGRIRRLVERKKAEKLIFSARIEQNSTGQPEGAEFGSKYNGTVCLGPSNQPSTSFNPEAATEFLLIHTFCALCLFRSFYLIFSPYVRP